MDLLNIETLPLILFNEKVDRLEKCRLTQRMATPHYEIQYDKLLERNWVAADGVTEDDVDAFVLNIRLLIQDRDGFSIRRLWEDIYQQPQIPRITSVICTGTAIMARSSDSVIPIFSSPRERTIHQW